MITNNIIIDLDKPGNPPLVHAWRGESNARQIKIRLFSGGESWEVPTGATLIVSYRRRDGSTGSYDTVDGSAAVTVDGADRSLVTVALHDDLMLRACEVAMDLTIQGGTDPGDEDALTITAHWLLMVHVPAGGLNDGGEGQGYVSVADLWEIVEDMQSHLTTAEDALAKAIKVTSQSWTNNQRARARANISAASGWTENAHLCLYNGVIYLTAGMTRTVQITDIVNFQTEDGVYPAINSVVIGSNGGVGILTKPSAESNDYLITSTGKQIKAQRPPSVLLYNGNTGGYDPVTPREGDVVEGVSAQTLLPSIVAFDGVVVGDIIIDVNTGYIAEVTAVENQYFTFTTLGIHLGGNS